MKRKALSLLLALAMAISLLPAHALATGLENPGTGVVLTLDPVGDPDGDTVGDPVGDPAGGATARSTPIAIESDLTGAVAAAADGVETLVQLTGDISLASAPLTIPASKVIVLDLNGHTLSAATTADVIDNSGTLTVKNGTVAAKDDGANTQGMGVDNLSGAVLTVDQDENFTTLLIGRSGLQNAGSATVRAGTVESYNRNAYWGAAGSTLVVEDGRFLSETGSSGMGRAVSADGDVTIHGGYFYAGGSSGNGDNYMNAIGIFNGGELVIDPAEGKTVTVISDTDYAVGVRDGSPATIKGGSFTCNGDRVDVKNIDDLDGCNITITGGSFRQAPDPAYLAEGCVAKVENGRFVVQQAAAPSAVTVNSYDELAAVLNGDILQPKNITLGADVTLPAGASLTLQSTYTLTVPAGKTLTVDGILSLEGAMSNAGTLAVGDSGFVEHPLYITNTGTIAGFPAAENGVCRISTPMELQWLTCLVEWDNNNIPDRIELTGDITMPAVEFTPIAFSQYNFYWGSVFDGRGHAIIGLNTVVESSYRGGLFGFLGDVTVMDLIVQDATVTSTSSYIGAVAGYVTGNTVFSNVQVKGCTVSSPISYGVGGFVGQIADDEPGNRVEFIGCAMENTSVTGYANVGGFWGTSTGSKGTIGIYNSTLAGTVNAINVNGAVCGGFANSAPVQVIGLEHTGLKTEGKATDTLLAHTTAQNDLDNAGPENTAVKDQTGAWVLKGPDDPANVTVNGAPYASLAAALSAAGSGDVIRLEEDMALDSRLELGNDGVTLDLNGHTLTASDAFQPATVGNSSHLVNISGANVTLKNGTLKTTAANKHGVNVYWTSGAVLEDLTIDHTAATTGAPLVVNGSDVTVNGTLDLLTGANSWYGANVDSTSDSRGASLTVAAGASLTLDGTLPAEALGIKLERSKDTAVSLTFAAGSALACKPAGMTPISAAAGAAVTGFEDVGLVDNGDGTYSEKPAPTPTPTPTPAPTEDPGESGDQGGSAPAATPAPTAEPVPTATPVPLATARPVATPDPQPTQAPQAEGDPVNVTASVEAQVSENTAVAAVDSTQLTESVQQALDGAAQSGGAPQVTLEIQGDTGAQALEVTLPVEALTPLADAEGGVLTLSSGVARLSFDPIALSAIVEQAGEELMVQVAPVDASELNEAQVAAAGDFPVYALRLISDGADITELGQGYATVTLPHTLADDQHPDGVVVWYLDEEGNTIPCDTSFDPEAGTVTFTAPAMARCVVAYDESLAPAPTPTPTPAPQAEEAAGDAGALALAPYAIGGVVVLLILVFLLRWIFLRRRQDEDRGY